jgi:hypothetical protein
MLVIGIIDETQINEIVFIEKIVIVTNRIHELTGVC